MLGGAAVRALLIARTVFDSGLGLWVVSSFALAALVRERDRESAPDALGAVLSDEPRPAMEQSP